jgi:heterodisulfide reductase subunit A
LRVYPQVVTTMEFERLVSASGPTAGKVRLNGREPKKIVFIHCVGSRDRSLNLPNCSRVCCMAVAKQAHLAHDRQSRSMSSYGRACLRGFDEFTIVCATSTLIGGNLRIIHADGSCAEDTLLGSWLRSK